MSLDNSSKHRFLGGVFWIVFVTGLVIYMATSFFSFHNFSLPYLFPTTIKSSEVVVVSIDDESIKTYGKWPWNRNFQMKIFQKILSNDPKKLGLDVIYSDLNNETETNSKLIEILKNPKVVSAEQLNSTNSGVLYEGVKDVSTGFIEFNIDNHSFVRRAVTKIGSKESLAQKMVESDTVPENFLINPRTARPTVISVRDLMENDNLGKILKDKYVFFGTSALALNDFHNLPGIGQIPGVEIHGLVLQQILENQFWQEYIINWPIFLIFIIALAFLNQYIFRKFGIKNLKKILLLVNIVLGVIYLGFVYNHIFIDLNATSSVLATTAIMPISLWVWSLSDERENIKKALSLYISAKVMQKIMTDPSKIDLGGKKYSSSIMFTDIRGFTSLSEEAENVHEVATLLNQILALQTDIILNNDGVVDKYIGDAVMAFWGAPIPTQDYAYQSILSACQIQAAIEKFNLSSEHQMEVGVGINTGVCLIGNFGSTKRVDYTAIGDTVNTASRIESITKFYGAKIVISESTVEMLTEKQKQEFWIEELDTIRLKGKHKTIKVFEVIGQKEVILELDSKQKEKLDKYSLCLKNYYAGDFDAAIILAQEIDLKRAEIIKTRCELLQKENNPDWDGVWTFDHK
jgi:adenylate cyclase